MYDEATPEEWEKALANQGLVGWYLNRNKGLFRDRDDQDEAWTDGFMGLLRAVQKFDPAHGTTFATYAVYWIRQAVNNGIMSRAGLNERAAHRDGLPYDRPMSLDADRGNAEQDGEATLGGYLESLDVTDETVIARMRLDRAAAVIHAACRDDLDCEIARLILTDPGGRWVKPLAARVGLSYEAIRLRVNRLRSAARKADRAAELVGADV